MKKILFIILLCLNIQLTYGIDYSPYSNRYGGYTRVSSERTYERIGYTSQYGNGFSNTKSTYYYPTKSHYNTNHPFSKITYDKYHSNAIYPGNTYDNYHSNYSSGGGSHGGQPRRVVIHNPNKPNDSLDTHLQDDWDPNWSYYHGGLLHNWYYYDGKYHYWDETSGTWKSAWGIVGIGLGIDSQDKSAHASAPIGDGLVPLSLLCLGYILYRRRSNFFV